VNVSFFLTAWEVKINAVFSFSMIGAIPQQHSITSQKTWILNHTISRNLNIMIYLKSLVRREYCYQHSDGFIYNAICSGKEVIVGVLVCIMSHTNSLYLDMGTEDLGLDGSGSSSGFLQLFAVSTGRFDEDDLLCVTGDCLLLLTVPDLDLNFRDSKPSVREITWCSFCSMYGHILWD